jgi:hypothetical protein
VEDGDCVSDDSVGRLANVEHWQARLPAEVFEALQTWIRGQPFDLHNPRWYTEGESGSLVADVRVHPHLGMVTGAILKILPEELGIQESRAVALAEKSGPRMFVEAHLTKTQWIGPLPGLSGWWLHLQDVAQAGTARMVPLAELTEDDHLAEYCYVILAAIADGWNTGDDDPPPVTMSIGDFLRADLASKIAGLRAFAQASGWDPNSPAPTITFSGRPVALPNPLRVLPEGSDPGPEVAVFLGKGHGDLHVNNVLVPVDAGVVQADRFQLIDLGRFSSTMPISRDPVKLLLSVAARWLQALVPASPIRSSLAELVVTPGDVPRYPSVAGYVDVARRVNAAAARWAERRRLVRDWHEQHRLVLAAAALRTVARSDIADADRWWFMEVAALALRPYLPAPDDDPPNVPPPTPPTLPVATREPESRPAVALDVQRLGNIKVTVNRRLATDWQDLADVLGMPIYERARVPVGNEGRYIWEWLEVRGELGELPAALSAIGRDDLAALFEGGDPGE